MKKGCINPTCKREQMTRGLCKYCYVTVRGLIRRKLVTEESLLLSGKMLPKKKPSRPYGELTNWFLEK